MAANELIDFPLAAQRDTPRFPVSFSSKLPLAGALGISVRAGPYSWLADRQRLIELGQLARRLAVERYDWERVVDALATLCTEVSQK